MKPWTPDEDRRLLEWEDAGTEWWLRAASLGRKIGECRGRTAELKAPVQAVAPAGPSVAAPEPLVAGLQEVPRRGPPPRKRREIVALALQGLTRSEIAERVGVSRHALVVHLGAARELGELPAGFDVPKGERKRAESASPRKPREPRARAKPEKAGAPEPRPPPRHTGGQTPEQAERVQAMYEMRAGGASWDQIGAAFARDRSTVIDAVRRHCARHGLEMPVVQRERAAGDGPEAWTPRVPGPWPGYRACQWIDGDPAADAARCGAATLPGYPYCRPHAARCYVLPGARPGAAA